LQYMKSIIMGLRTLLLGFLAFQIILMFMEWMKYMQWRFYMLCICVMQVMLWMHDLSNMMTKQKNKTW
jgi:hypothetical protein